MPRNKLQPCFTSLTETSLHEPLTDHKIARAALGTVTVRSTVGSTVRTLEVLTESPDTFFWRVPYISDETNCHYNCIVVHKETEVVCQVPPEV